MPASATSTLSCLVLSWFTHCIFRGACGKYRKHNGKHRKLPKSSPVKEVIYLGPVTILSTCNKDDDDLNATLTF